MPHLSPMNWLTMLIMIWMLLLTLLSSSWWMQPASWPSQSITSSTIKSSWKWHFKGGRK